MGGSDCPWSPSCSESLVPTLSVNGNPLRLIPSLPAAQSPSWRDRAFRESAPHPPKKAGLGRALVIVGKEPPGCKHVGQHEKMNREREMGMGGPCVSPLSLPAPP